VVIAGIGYQGRIVDEVVAALRRCAIGVVLDVREVPFSRRPDFSKSRLAQHLGDAGMRYLHLREAGNPREIRRTSSSSEECLARYRDHLAREPQVLKQILEAAAAERVALLCFEADARECHRSILLEQLASLCSDIEVVAL
jgi:uncharacterized protein (DUF488 family)